MKGKHPTIFNIAADYIVNNTDYWCIGPSYSLCTIRPQSLIKRLLSSYIFGVQGNKYSILNMTPINVSLVSYNGNKAILNTGKLKVQMGQLIFTGNYTECFSSIFNVPFVINVSISDNKTSLNLNIWASKVNMHVPNLNINSLPYAVTNPSDVKLGPR